MTISYACAINDAYGDAELFNESGVHFTTIVASRCHAQWYCEQNGWTWRWRGGVDPDDPSTWPQPLEVTAEGN